MLVNCVAYQEGKKLADIAVEDIRRHVSRRECFVWVALKDPEPAMLADMQGNFDLHELAVEDARHGHERPKIEEYGDSLFAVLHTVEMVGLELTVGEVDIFVGRNYVLSVRNRCEHGFTNVRARCEREPELLSHGAGFVFYALMDAVVDRYFPVLDTLEMELERVDQPRLDALTDDVTAAHHDDVLLARGDPRLVDSRREAIRDEAELRRKPDRGANRASSEAIRSIAARRSGDTFATIRF